MKSRYRITSCLTCHGKENTLYLGYKSQIMEETWGGMGPQNLHSMSTKGGGNRAIFLPLFQIIYAFHKGFITRGHCMGENIWRQWVKRHRGEKDDIPQNQIIKRDAT